MESNISHFLKYYKLTDKKEYLLESGEKFAPVTIAYETFGKLNPEKDNAILVIHALSGDTHVTSCFDEKKEKPGWWDIIVGSGLSIDTDKNFIICSNCFGGCYGTTGPSSINPDTGKPYGLAFPFITVNDMVRVQKELIDHLGIKKIKCVIGGSLGGMQVLEWAYLYPDMVEKSVVIASAYKTSPQVIGFGEIGRNSIMADANFNNGNYYEGKKPETGLSIARMVAHLTYLSHDSMEKKFGRDIKEMELESDKLYGQFGPIFQVGSYLKYQGKKFVERFDANTYLYITKAMDLYDFTKNRGSIYDAVKRITSKMLVISFTTDWHFKPSESWEIVKAMMASSKEISYVNIDSPYGHDAFLIKNEELERIISSFIN